jgi:hypothetical protein
MSVLQAAQPAFTLITITEQLAAQRNVRSTHASFFLIGNAAIIMAALCAGCGKGTRAMCRRWHQNNHLSKPPQDSTCILFYTSLGIGRTCKTLTCCSGLLCDSCTALVHKGLCSATKLRKVESHIWTHPGVVVRKMTLNAHGRW